MADAVGNWLCARTRFNQEISIRQQLESRGIRYFIPTRRSVRRLGNSVKEVEVPVIPNLVFIYVCWDEAFALFNSLQNRLNYIRQHDKKILVIPSVQMELFMRLIMEMHGNVVLHAQCFAVGDRVIIKNGNLAGVEGVLVSVEGKKRFAINLEGLLSASVRICQKDLMKLK